MLLRKALDERRSLKVFDLRSGLVQFFVSVHHELERALWPQGSVLVVSEGQVIVEYFFDPLSACNLLLGKSLCLHF